MCAGERAIEKIGIVLEPRELLVDRGLLRFIEHETGAHPVIQVVVVLAVVMLPFARHRDRGGARIRGRLERGLWGRSGPLDRDAGSRRSGRGRAGAGRQEQGQCQGAAAGK